MQNYRLVITRKNVETIRRCDSLDEATAVAKTMIDASLVLIQYRGRECWNTIEAIETVF